MLSLSSSKKNIAVTAWRKASFVAPPPHKIRNTGYHPYMTEVRGKVAWFREGSRFLEGLIQENQILRNQPNIKENANHWGGGGKSSHYKQKRKQRSTVTLNLKKNYVSKVWNVTLEKFGHV